MKLLFTFYGLILLALTIFSYGFVDQNLVFLQRFYTGFAFENRLTTTVAYSIFIILLFIFYGVFIYLFKKGILQKKDIKTLIIISCVSLFLSYPAMLSYDIFNYLTTAKLLFIHHENPYVIMPIELIGDPYLSFTRAANKLVLYGPFWVLLSGIPFLFSFGNFVFLLASFKLLNIAFYLATIFMIWKLGKNLLPILLFAFNPLVLIETLVSNHNDIVMVFLTLVVFLSVKERKYLLALCFFVLSVLIKYATIFLIPVFIYILWISYKNKTINWERIYIYSAFSMFVIFLLSPIREELYPWYAIWFLPFVFLISEKRYVIYLSCALTFGLMLRYIPFMYLGTYFGPTPLIRNVLTLVPLVLTGIFLSLKSYKYARK